MFPKVLEYRDPQFRQTMEPRVRLLEPHRGKAGFCKHASADLNDYLSTVSPVPGKRYVLVLAMSDSEHYGPNRNGDGFAEKPVRVAGEWAIAPGETLLDYYKTFESQANVFRHHINQDPDKGFGTVDKAFYNLEMHRVELLLEIDEAAGHDIIGKLDAGEFPGVSMGCRIKYDVCNICANKAPTRNDYCDHVNGMNPEFGMNQLLDDGRLCFVWNPCPNLFDLSFVFKPADRIGYTMKKVAYSDPYKLNLSADLGQKVAHQKQKRAELKKISEIDKLVRGEVADTDVLSMKPSECSAVKSLMNTVVPSKVRSMPQLPGGILESMSNLSFPRVLSSMNVCGMIPTAREMHIIISKKNDVEPDPEVGDRIADIQGILAAVLADMPHLMDTIEETGLTKVSEDLVDVYTVNNLRPYMEKRGLWENYIAREHVPESWGGVAGEMTGAFDPQQAYYAPVTRNLHYQDPNSGRTYQTTQHAAERADWENLKKKGIEAAGIAALLGVSVKSLGASPRWKWLAAPAAVGAGGLGYKAIKDQRVPQVQTQEGIKVPANTEFVEKRSSVAKDLGVPIVGGALATFLLAQDHLRSNNGEGQSPMRAALGQEAEDNPVLTTALGTGLLSAGMHSLKGVRGRFKRAMQDLVKTASSSSPSEPPSVSFGDLVYRVGEFVTGLA